MSIQGEHTSSLGLLEDMSYLTNVSSVEADQLRDSSKDAKLEIARKSVQRCSELKNLSQTIDIDKENNSNMQNMTNILPVSNLVLSNNIYIPDSTQECNMNCSLNKTSTSVAFEPNDITARSSGFSKNVKKQQKSLPLNKSDEITFGESKILGQISNEKSVSNLQIIEQLSGNEASQQQNCTFPIATTDIGKRSINLSSFSGIIGKLDSTTESCAGEKVSGDYSFNSNTSMLLHKCNNIEVLEDNAKVISHDFNIETPKKEKNFKRLAAILSRESKDYEQVSDATTGIYESSIISLSTIVNTLQDVNSETPRRLIDQLLMAQRKKKYAVQNNQRKETYMLSLKKESMAVSSIINCDKPDKDIDNLFNLTKNLSLNSKATNKIMDTKQQLANLHKTFASSESKEVESFVNVHKDKIFKKDTNNSNTTSIDTDIELLENSALSLLSNYKLKMPSCVSPTLNLKTYEESYNDKQNVKRKIIKEENIFNDTMHSSSREDTNTEIQPDMNNELVIGKNTEQLCNCIVGMIREANIEFKNQGNKWIMYSLKLSEIQGNEQNIELNIPQNTIVIKPNQIQFTKIKVKIINMCKPIIVVLNIIVSDLETNSVWFIKHMICFKPEQLELDIICNSDKQELDFQYITENSTKVLPIIFHNKNNIDVPIILSILHNKSKIFNIDSIFNGSVELKDSHGLTHLVLKSQEKIIAHIKCEGLPPVSIENSQQLSQCWKSKLVMLVKCSDGIVLFKKEVPLYAQAGTCKIQVIDTDIPIVISTRQQSKLISIINSGNVETHVSATIVPIEGHPDSVENFSIEPDNIFLQPGERNSFLIAYKLKASDAEIIDIERYVKVQLVAGNNVYYYSIQMSIEQKLLTLKNGSCIHSDTLCNFLSATSLTSPQNVVSSSRIDCSRNSPSSTISSVTVEENILPIKATHVVLVWNSVKTGKSEIKEFSIRNTSNNKIKIQIDICDNNSFKFVGDKQISNTKMILVMQRAESKTISVMFSPYHIGPVTGKMTIKYYRSARESSESKQQKRISLYGYGGYTKMKISDTLKDASGKMWLSLGTLSSGTTAMKANIKLQNTGDLCSFAKIKVIPKVISLVNTDWHINPKELILHPKKIRQISIEFHPKKNDFAILQRSDVSHVATINITYGDEPTRWRIRKLYNKLKELGKLTENEEFKNIIHPICKMFPEEQPISGLPLIRDSIQHLSDLCTGIQQYEIMLTVEACADDTFPILHDTCEELHLYYSLLNDNSHMNEMDGASYLVSQTMESCEAISHEFEADNFTVTPSIVFLNPATCNEATVTVLSLFKVAEPFWTYISNSELSVAPAEGMLPSKKSFSLKIQCSQRIQRDMQAVLEIYTENNKQEVRIKVNMK